jgi:microcystin-dependent protein
MSDQFLAEIRMVGFNFAPRGWATCDGQIMPISQNTALFSLLGTNYGGNGTVNFGLPNLQACAPIQSGQGPGLTSYFTGETLGTQTITLSQTQMPAHTHAFKALNTIGDNNNPNGAVPARVIGETPYVNATANVPLANSLTAAAGGNQPHNNMMPYLVINFCIALQGIFPPRS